MSTQVDEKAETEETTPEVKPVDMDKFAKSGQDTYISTIWPKFKGALNSLTKLGKDLEKFTPPKETEIYAFVRSEDGLKDEVIAKAEAACRKLEKALEEQRTISHQRAKEILQPESVSPEKLNELRSEFDKQRDAVAGQLGAIQTFSETMAEANSDLYGPVLAAVKEVALPRKPYGLSSAGGSGTSAYTPDPKIKAFKEWADKNNVSYPSRGRIPQDKMDAFKNSIGADAFNAIS